MIDRTLTAIILAGIVATAGLLIVNPTAVSAVTLAMNPPTPSPPPLDAATRAELDADAVLQAAGVSYALRIAGEADGLRPENCLRLRDRLAVPLAVLTLDVEDPNAQAHLRAALERLRRVPVGEITLELDHALKLIRERRQAAEASGP